MAQKYVPLADAAKYLGISEDELTNLRNKQEITGYRDGPTWKFKEEDIHRLATDLKQRETVQEAADLDDDELTPVGDLAPDDLDDDSILLSEQALGESSGATSSTIIGKSDAEQGGDSDINLSADADAGDEISDLKLDAGSSDVRLAGDSDVLGGGEGTRPMQASGLSLDESGLSLDDEDDVTLGEETPAAGGSGGGSALELADDEDDLVLGDTGGSDITIGGGDSGISLLDAADSGLSLEEPLELTGSGSNVESMELGEDDVVSLEEDADLDAATQLKADDDFLLTPMEEADDASDSGSQVIALDSEEGFEDSAVGGVPMASMLEEDLGAMPGAGGLISPDAAPMMHQTVVVQEKPEYPFSLWNVLSLFGCITLLTVTGMMMFDLVLNMWSWDGSYELNSSLMDAVLSWFK